MSLRCPACGAAQPEAERFCPSCGVPLVFDAGAPQRPVSEQHARARKVRSEYAQGELVKVAGARNQPESELIQGMLLEEGIPSLVRRSGGFDVPDFLASGPRDILVPLSGLEAARALLKTPASAATATLPSSPWVKVMAIVLVAIVVGSVAGALLVSVLR